MRTFAPVGSSSSGAARPARSLARRGLGGFGKGRVPEDNLVAILYNMSRLTNEGGEILDFFLILGGDDMKISLPGTDLTNPFVKEVQFRPSLPIM